MIVTKVLVYARCSTPAQNSNACVAQERALKEAFTKAGLEFEIVSFNQGKTKEAQS